MAVKMVVFWFSLVLFIVGSQASGEFDVIHSPRSLKFSGSSRTYESLLKEIFSASLGLSVEEDAEWDGLSIVDPFATPEAVVEVYVDGISSLDNVGLKAHAFPLIVDQYEPDTFEAIQHRIQQRFGEGANKLVKFRLSDQNDLAYYSKTFGDLAPPEVPKKELQHLKMTVEEDLQFITELEMLKAITAKVQSGVIVPDNIIDFYNFRFQSLHPLSDFHGPNSLQVKEAKRLLGQAIVDLGNAFVKAYHGSALVAAVATDVAHTRRVRAAPSTDAPARDLPQESARQKRGAAGDRGQVLAPAAGGAAGAPSHRAEEPPAPEVPNAPPAPEVPNAPPAPEEPSAPPAPEVPNAPPAPDANGTTKPPEANGTTKPPEANGTTKPPEANGTTKPPPRHSIASNENAFSDDYAAIFNIMLWFGLVYVFALAAVVHALATMDPGRDSIIYRMTNPRMKKDN